MASTTAMSYVIGCARDRVSEEVEPHALLVDVVIDWLARDRLDRGKLPERRGARYSVVVGVIGNTRSG